MKHYRNTYQKFTDLTEKAVGIDPVKITNCVIMFLFIKIYTIKTSDDEYLAQRPLVH